MVRPTPTFLAEIGRLATPPQEALGGAAQDKARDFFREVCRLLPWTIENYRLNELITLPALRRNVSTLIRKHSDIQNPRVIDVLIYKGREDLEATYLQHKQRHHLIQEYVAKPEQLRQIAFQKRNRKTSVFLDNFYRNVPQHESAVDIDKTTIPG